jgi:hypothetical protein
MTRRCELTLTDESLLAEIELLGDVIVAVNLLSRPLTEAEIDEALGLPHRLPRVDKVHLSIEGLRTASMWTRAVRALLTPLTPGLRRSPTEHKGRPA